VIIKKKTNLQGKMQEIPITRNNAKLHLSGNNIKKNQTGTIQKY
jgi:hypothetical protein